MSSRFVSIHISTSLRCSEVLWKKHFVEKIEYENNRKKSKICRIVYIQKILPCFWNNSSIRLWKIMQNKWEQNRNYREIKPLNCSQRTFISLNLKRGSSFWILSIDPKIWTWVIDVFAKCKMGRSVENVCKIQQDDNYLSHSHSTTLLSHICVSQKVHYTVHNK